MRAASVLLLLLPALLAGCASPTAPGDEDGDGLSDEYETTPRDLYVVFAGNETVLRVTSDPTKRDTDGDGLTDFEEAAKATNPSDVDTDGDGLVDGRSTRLPADLIASRRLVTAPGDATLVVGEADACGQPVLNPAVSDSDKPWADGIDDGDEVRGWDVTARGGTYHVQSDPCSPDSDSDGLDDSDERDRGCDPRDGDTDADGAGDVFDVACAENVRVVVELDRIVMKRNMDPVSGSRLRFTVDAGGVRKEFSRDAAQPGSVTLGFSSDADVPDTRSGPNALETPVVITVVHAGVGRDQPVAVAGSSASVTVVYEAVSGTWTIDGRPGEGPATSDGTDATLHFSLRTVRE